MDALAGKVAVITGSSRGLGLAIAQAYAREGASVVVASRSPQGVSQAIAGLRESGFRADGMACDTGKLDDVAALADLALSRFGKLDIWVNNAGVGAPFGPTASISPDAFTAVVQTNILGVYHGSLVAMRHFSAAGSGKLINLLGRGADKPVPNQNAYSSSKAWVRWFSKSLAQEYKGSGVGVYMFNPGLVLTDMLTDVEAIEGYGEQMSGLNTVIRMWGNPPEVPAQKAVWLASSATDGKTGLEVNVLGPRLIVGGAVREMLRRVTGRPPKYPDVKVSDVPAEPATQA